MAADLVPPPLRTPADVWRKATRRAFRSFHVDLRRDPGDTAFVAGSGRSGTTWIAEALNRDNAYRYLFEPFHPGEGGGGVWFAPRTYARPGVEEPRIAGPIRMVLEGRVRDPWTDQYNRKPVARRRLVKDVWANLLLGWIHHAYPRVRILLVLRHPLAVVESQLLTGWDWRVDPSWVLGQPRLVADHMGALAGALQHVDDPIDRHVVTWCVENLVPLRQFSPGQVRVAFYEDLWADPGRELPPIFEFLGRRWNPRAVEAIGRPSALARRAGAVGVGRGPIDSWRESLSKRQIDRAMGWISLFGLDRIYGRDPMPLVKGPAALDGFPAPNTG